MEALMKKREKIMEYVFLLAAVISIVAVALHILVCKRNPGNEENRICGSPDRNQVEAGKQ